MTIKKLLISCLLLIPLTSCVKEKPRPIKLSTIRPQISGTQVIEMKISRAEYTKALQNQKALQRLRMVPLLRSAKFATGIPEYRLFDVEPGSAADVLGLKNSDVLIAVDDFILYDSQKFKSYLMLLQNEQSSNLEVQRESKPILFKYVFY